MPIIVNNDNRTAIHILHANTRIVYHIVNVTLQYTNASHQEFWFKFCNKQETDFPAVLYLDKPLERDVFALICLLYEHEIENRHLYIHSGYHVNKTLGLMIHVLLSYVLYHASIQLNNRK